MAGHKNHDYHILAPSPWPVIGAGSALVMLIGAVLWMKGGQPWVFAAGFLAVLYTMYGWWRDVIGESLAGDHTPVVQIGLRYGMILFIISEVMFFSAWFGSFFASAITPQGEIVGTEYVAGTWPPEGIETLDPWHLPLINTLILLCSGCAATWAHHALVHENDKEQMKWGLWLAIGLGILFTTFQAYE